MTQSSLTDKDVQEIEETLIDALPVVEDASRSLQPVTGQMQEIVQSPEQVIENAVKIAKLLKEIVEKSNNKGIIIVGGHEYLCFQSWQTIAEFYGYTAQIESTEKLIDDDGNCTGYKAKAVLVNLKTGQSMPGAEAICQRKEQTWTGKPEFQVMSMAQTRACSKTLSNKFRWVATLAGYEGTPAEEMTGDERPTSYPQQSSTATTHTLEAHRSSQILIVKREGRNQGKQFRACRQCNWFEWV